MSALDNRRGFLRGLVSLPLVGGGVTLVGQPTAVAEPVTQERQLAYESWLSHEFDRISHELHGQDYREAQRYRWFIGPAHDFHRGNRRTGMNDAFGNHSPTASTRAALVLSAVGCDWREDDRHSLRRV